MDARLNDGRTRISAPRPSAIGWERENRAPCDCGSNRFGNCKRWGLAVPSPVGRERVRVRVNLVELRLLLGTHFCTNPEHRPSRRVADAEWSAGNPFRVKINRIFFRGILAGCPFSEVNTRLEGLVKNR